MLVDNDANQEIEESHQSDNTHHEISSGAQDISNNNSNSDSIARENPMSLSECNQFAADSHYEISSVAQDISNNNSNSDSIPKEKQMSLSECNQLAANSFANTYAPGKATNTQSPAKPIHNDVYLTTVISSASIITCSNY